MPTAPADDLVVMSNVTKVYEPTPRWMRSLVRTHIHEPVYALNGIDLVVRAGDICAIVGPNGAGKTTLFRIIVGLTTPSSGSGHVLGFDVEHESEKVRQVVGWMPAEDRSLLMRATCKENLHLHGRLQGIPARELNVRIDDALGVVGLSKQRDSIAASLSSGMKARLRLARALLPEPQVLILDEPTGAIDPIAAHGLLELIMELARDHRLGVLLSSHRLEEIEALQSFALLLDGGRTKYAGDLDELRSAWDELGLDITFSNAAVARRFVARLTATGIETEIQDCTVRCRLEGRTAIGDLLAEMDVSDRREIRKVTEFPLPLRDLIARVYSGMHEERTRGRRVS